MPQILPSHLLRRLTPAAAGLALALVALLPGQAAAKQLTHSGTTSFGIPGLGLPDHFGFAVADVHAVRGKLAAATGTQFSPVTTSTKNVLFVSPPQLKQIHLKQTRSVRGGPFIEIVQASQALGPWAANASSATFFLSYAVDHVLLSSVKLAQAGMTPVALSGDDFAFWKGSGGVLVRLIDKDLVPATGGVNQSQAPIDLGAPAAVAIAPCNQAALKAQLGTALSLDWRAPFAVTLPYEYAADPGVTHVHDTTLDISVLGPPFVTLDEALHAPQEYWCTPTTTPVHIIFLAANVPVAAQQVLDAGMPWIARAPGLTSFHGTQGVFIEVVDASFLSAVIG